MATATKTFQKSKILKVAQEMTATDFLLEFDSAVEIDSMDNILDANDGMVNICVTVSKGKSTEDIYLLFIDGKYDCYSL